VATTTTNYSLRKPASSDVVNVTTDISDSMDTIDSNLKRVDDAATQPPRCRVHQIAGSLTTLTNNAWTPVTFAGVGHEDYDTASIHDPGSNTDRLTIPSNGSYQVSGKGAIDNADADGVRGTRWTKNGTVVPGTVIIDTPPVVGTVCRMPAVTTTIACIAGDIIRLEIYQDCGANIDTSVGGDAGDVSFAEIRKVAAS
jgi:hypothetical protein